MLFNSHGFILAFLPLAVVLYFWANKVCASAGQVLLLLFSIAFIGLNGMEHAAVALLSMLCNFGFFTRIRQSDDRRAKKRALTAGVLFNVAVLCLFKCAGAVGASLFFPIGISFYTFQQIAFLVDAFRDPAPEVRLLDYAVFTMYFPKFLQGPIPFSHEILPQLGDSSRKELRFDQISKGIYLFAIGLAKKELLADNFSIIADYGHQNVFVLSSYEAILTVLAYTFQLYFDFSGYSDMAVGIGYMFNIELPINFNSPYKARNITDFWNRWHITLTRFLTKYIYIPLGGNRKGLVRTCLNITAVYLVSGLWHGSGVTFLVWGLLHAAASILYRLFKKDYDRVPGVIQWIVQFMFINITWVFFRAESLHRAFGLIMQIFVGGWQFSIDYSLKESLLQPTMISIASKILTFDVTIPICFVIAFVMVLFAKNSNEKAESFRPTVSTWLVTYLLLMMSILSLAGVSSFLYTNF